MKEKVHYSVTNRFLYSDLQFFFSTCAQRAPQSAWQMDEPFDALPQQLQTTLAALLTRQPNGIAGWGRN